MRRTIKDVEYYINAINKLLRAAGKDYVYGLGIRNGYKAIDKALLNQDMNGDYYPVWQECVRSGLTTGQAYDVAYAMYEVVRSMV